MAVTLKRSPGRRALLAVSALLALLGTFLVFTGSASAHHSEISGSADCDGLVTWTAEAWNGSTEAERTNGSVKVWYRIGGGSAVDVATGSFNKSNNYQFSGSLAWPDASATSLVLYVQEQQNWANGAGIGSARSTTVSLPTNCPTPEVGVSATCTTVTVTSTKDISNVVWQAQNGAEGKFDGLSGLSYTFANDPANPIVKVWVKSANNFLKPGDPAPNGNWGQGVGTYLSVPVPTGCQGTPQVSSAVACANGNGDVTITLKNTGGFLPVTFTVTDPRTNQGQQVQVAVGETKTVVLTGFADGEHTIPVSAGGVSFDQKVTVTCDRPGVPEATVALECVEGDGVATVTLKNTGGDLPVTFSVKNPATGQTTNHQVAVGQTKTVVLGDLPDGTHTVEIRSGQQSFDQTITVSCDRPGVGGVTLSQDCVEGDGVVTVTLKNESGDLPVQFVVTNPATGAKTTVNVAVGATEQVVLGDLPDGTHTIGITADGKNLDQTITVDCDRPGVPDVKASVACEEGDGVVTVTLRNTGGDLPIAFEVKNPDTGVTTSVSVAVGETKTVVLGDLPDGTHTVGITADGAKLDKVVVVDCDRPGVASVTVAQECVEGDGVATVTLQNTGGDLPVSFEVTNPATGQKSTVTVAVGESEQVVLGDLPDGTHTIVITADGENLDQTITVDCDRPGVPDVEVTQACTDFDGVVTIELSNTGGDLPIEFSVTDPVTDAVTTYTVAVGESETVVFDGLADGVYALAITADGADLGQQVTVDCDRPGVADVDVSLGCVADGGRLVVTLANTSAAGEAEPIEFVVTDPTDGTETTVTVAAGESEEVIYDGLADGEYTVEVTADGEALEPLVVQVDCEKPAVDGVVQECAEDGVVVRFSNGGGTPAIVEVEKNGAEIETVKIPANGTAEITVPMIEDEQATITVKHDEVVIDELEITRNCEDPTVPPAPTSPPAQVAGVQQTPSTGTLPVTGRQTAGYLVIALSLVLAGALILEGNRRASRA